jgi:hypothetical protein
MILKYNNMILGIYLIIVVVQYYICWATYRNWFWSEITSFEMIDSYSIAGMILFLPICVWIPLSPLILFGFGGDYKYITLIWRSKECIRNRRKNKI